ncbi:Hsp104 [Emiliania huxleyi CCMP1516]|uniref:Clp R domain-containing protein n=2 Tax=Emiliania huxleyi TaxID=2903 RepID=A0A0D3JWY9_EMIH1|nr:Hsp104 [Emiliania huxleyi CCMP1516]EOD28024.1 Hsp104 [Emiliania huxleyi CCMP1516]|eukprot:XP_005780453.1 Hsp104 [Emiliania huxleyi CCMP1516]
MPTVTVHGFILTVAAVAGVHISPRLAYRAEHVHTRGRIPSASALPAGRYVGCAAGRRSAPPVLFFDQYDKDAMRLIMDAQTEARQLGVEAIGTDHLLLSATLQRDGVAAALKRSGVETKAVRDELARAAGGGVSAGNPLEKLFASTAKDELLPFASDTERSLRAALDDAKGRGAELVSPKGLMLSAVAEGASDGGSAAALLASLGVDVAAVVKELKRSDAEAVGAGGERRKGGNSTLEQCSVDLTQRAREGKLDPCVGRADEVRRCMKILVRRRKSNPVLIGDPGVGKTAIPEGIAQRIVDGDAPERLLGMRVLSLELGLLVADTKYRGEFEERLESATSRERLKSVIEEVTQSNETVLFIDEIHTLVGAGAAEGAIDAANLLKPALARGELQCIGATTIAEYRKYIEKDAALERRFQAVKVDEPSVAETASILTGLRPKYEEYHGVKYSDGAIAAAAELGARYISDRFNPDKAIDLIDEAGAALQMEAYDGGGAAGATVGEAEIAEVVADWTGIPVTKLTADERKER